MAKLDLYRQIYGPLSPDDLFEAWFKDLRPAVLDWEYFVNWDKVQDKIKGLKVEIHLLNSLIGATDWRASLKELILKYPSVVKVFPYLAVRSSFGSQLSITDLGNRLNFNFEEPDPACHQDYLTFFEKTGLANLTSRFQVTNFYDYLVGVEAGVDSNGRKNRVGYLMEKIVGDYLEAFCSQTGAILKKQPTVKDLGSWPKISSCYPPGNQHRPDFLVLANHQPWAIIEVNLYNTSGSKLKATAGDYRVLADKLKAVNQRFIWVTDGAGWQGTKQDLRVAFNQIDYLFNLAMLERQVLTLL